MFVEKPFTVTSAEGDRVITFTKETGKLLTIYQSQSLPDQQHPISSGGGLLCVRRRIHWHEPNPDRRYDSDFPILRHLVNKRAFGTATECKIHYDMHAHAPSLRQLNVARRDPRRGHLVRTWRSLDRPGAAAVRAVGQRDRLGAHAAQRREQDRGHVLDHAAVRGGSRGI